MRTVLLVFIASILFSAPVSVLLFTKRDQSENVPVAIAIMKLIAPTPVPTPAPLTLSKVFSDNHSWPSALPTSHKRTLMVTGDVLLARNVNATTTRLNNFIWPFEKVAETIKDADITYINLESPLTEGCEISLGTMVFCGDPRNVEGLVFAGVDVANFANNHSRNFGQKGVDDTVKFLSASGILPSGIKGPVYKEIRGLKFSFLGYDEVFNSRALLPENAEQITKDILESKANADIVVVQFHWGNEYTTDITDIQRGLAHLAIDSGADLIIGNHPHWIQPVEIYKNKFIAYAHGNFVFDQEWSQKTKEGVVGKYTFYDKQLIDVEFLPVQIDNYGQPHFLSGEQKSTILNEMKVESSELTQ